MMIEELSKDIDKESIALPIEIPHSHNFLWARNYLTTQSTCQILSRQTKRGLHFDLDFTFLAQFVTFDIRERQRFFCDQLANISR